MSNPQLYARTILVDGAVAGNIGSWLDDGNRMVGYWIGREFWGRGVATAAVSQFLREVSHRPVMAHVAKHNAGSIRVLQKCGFTAIGENTFTGSDGQPAGELIFRLDETTPYASPACSMPEIED
ncbi:MAG TPA: GNAT family N-acetyltransferase, partial [Lacunisphaera sp.]